MKTFFTFLLTISTLTILNAQGPELLFFDDFEQDDISSSDKTFKQWTTENNAGDSYWQLIPSGTTNNSQCVRFESTEKLNDDWIITNQITTNELTDVIINFRHRFSGDRVKPKLMYTNQYDGTINESDWEEIDYSLGEYENKWQSIRCTKSVSGNTFYFALNFKTTEDDSISFLFDVFQVAGYNNAPPSDYNAPPSEELVGTSEHFEFYTSIADETDYWSEINDELENYFQKYD